MSKIFLSTSKIIDRGRESPGDPNEPGDDPVDNALEQ